ncbi:MAG: acyl-ACP--UDP-N-acetylglucosamine O-acyltransferase [candidate division Zixibacteria bacterium]|nr:acyl-ACP--UDP-N-acetylglucosamine O-acyltransferase [candidate division Zixibacteria bacterium]
MAEIHSTAIISERAQISDDVSIGPYSVIEGPAKIGSGTKISSHVLITGDTSIGENCIIHNGVVIGSVPQDLKFGGEETKVEIGDNNNIREYVTINRGTLESGVTKIGDNCLLMAYAHVAHDCRLGDYVIMANTVQLAGHVHLHDYAIIGGVTAIRQFVSIGAHSMVGGSYRVVQDVCPYALAAGYPLAIRGINSIGLRRRGFLRETLATIKSAFKILFHSEYNTTDALVKIEEELPKIEEIKTIVDFIKASRCGITKK